MSDQRNRYDGRPTSDIQRQVESDFELARRLQEMEDNQSFGPSPFDAVEQMFSEPAGFMRMNSPFSQPRPRPRPRPQGSSTQNTHRPRDHPRRRPTAPDMDDLMVRFMNAVSESNSESGERGRVFTFRTSSSIRRPSSATATATATSGRDAPRRNNTNNNNNNNNNNGPTPMDIEEEFFDRIYPGSNRHHHRHGSGNNNNNNNNNGNNNNSGGESTLESIMFSIGNQLRNELGGSSGGGGNDNTSFGARFHVDSGPFPDMHRFFAQMFNGGTFSEMDGASRSFEELLELVERMGGANNGATEEEIASVEKEKYSKELMDRIARKRQGHSESGRTQGAGSSSEKSGEEEEKCAICLGGYEKDEEVRVLPCQHVYHVECVDQWLKVKHLCPVCKKSIRDGAQGN